MWQQTFFNDRDSSTQRLIKSQLKKSTPRDVKDDYKNEKNKLNSQYCSNQETGPHPNSEIYVALDAKTQVDDRFSCKNCRI